MYVQPAHHILIAESMGNLDVRDRDRIGHDNNNPLLAIECTYHFMTIGVINPDIDHVKRTYEKTPKALSHS